MNSFEEVESSVKIYLKRQLLKVLTVTCGVNWNKLYSFRLDAKQSDGYFR
jgi:hypothetical protein